MRWLGFAEAIEVDQRELSFEDFVCFVQDVAQLFNCGKSVCLKWASPTFRGLPRHITSVDPIQFKREKESLCAEA